MEFPELDKGRLAWWALGFSLAAGLLFVAYSFVGTLVFGLFIYYATRPIYRQLRRALDNPSLAAAVSLVALALPALLLVGYALTIALQEIDKYASNAPIDIERLGIDPATLDRVADPATILQDALRGVLSTGDITQLLSSLGSAFGTVATLGIALVHLFVMLALAFYLLRDDHRLSRWFSHRFGDERGIVQAFFDAVDRDFNSIFFGNILNAVLTGTIGVITYSALNVFAPPELRIPAPALVGLLAGIASLVPVVGMKLVYVPVALVLLVQALLSGAAGTLAFVVAFAVVSFVVVDTIPDLVLRPYVSGRSLHVGAVMLAYTLGPLLFGWYGIFLMPMLLVLVVRFAHIVLPELMGGRPIEPYAIDPTHMSVDVQSFDIDGATEPRPDETSDDSQK
ncbi:MAG: AI-2E family transporter [Halolamina sp.]